MGIFDIKIAEDSARSSSVVQFRTSAKKSLATGIPEQAGINTPEAPSGTAFIEVSIF